MSLCNLSISSLLRVTGRDGGRDIDLRRFASEGMQLFGFLNDFKDGVFEFSGNLSELLDQADAVYNRINQTIDKYIAENNIDAPAPSSYSPVWKPEKENLELDLANAGITSIVWCIGFRPDFSWIDAPIFTGRGYPSHTRGITPQAGLYFLGLPWLYTWGSGRFSGIDRDAKYISEAISSAKSKIEAKEAA